MSPARHYPPWNYPTSKLGTLNYICQFDMLLFRILIDGHWWVISVWVMSVPVISGNHWSCICHKRGINVLRQHLKYIWFILLQNDSVNDWFIICTGWGDSAGPVTVLSVATSVAPNSTISRTVYIESTLGFNTKFTLDYASSRGVEFSLRFPGGRIYGINSDECTLDDSIQVISCAFPGNSMVNWLNWGLTSCKRVRYWKYPIWRYVRF